MTSTYDITIADFNSAGIRHIADLCGATHMRCIGIGCPEGREGQADYKVGFYAMWHPQGWEILVANTNGDPVFEDSDPEAFRELAEECGVEL